MIATVAMLMRQCSYIRSRANKAWRGVQEERRAEHQAREHIIRKRAARMCSGACPHRSRVRKMIKARWCIRRDIVLYVSTSRYKKYIKKIERCKKRYEQTNDTNNEACNENESNTVAADNTTATTEEETTATTVEASAQAVAATEVAVESHEARATAETTSKTTAATQTTTAAGAEEAIATSVTVTPPPPATTSVGPLLAQTTPSSNNITQIAEQVEEWKATEQGGFCKIQEENKRGGAGEGIKIPNNRFWNKLTRQLGHSRPVWGDGSCWAWAIMTCLQLTQSAYPNAPTTVDLAREKLWRAQVAQQMRSNGVPERVVRKTERGSVQWRNGKVTVTGEWGGEREMNALAVIHGVNIAVWDLTQVSTGGLANIFTSEGREYVLQHTMIDEIAVNNREQRGIRTLHVVYNGSHYEPLTRGVHPAYRLWNEESTYTQQQLKLLYNNTQEGDQAVETATKVWQSTSEADGESKSGESNSAEDVHKEKSKPQKEARKAQRSEEKKQKEKKQASKAKDGQDEAAKQEKRNRKRHRPESGSEEGSEAAKTPTPQVRKIKHIYTPQHTSIEEHEEKTTKEKTKKCNSSSYKGREKKEKQRRHTTKRCLQISNEKDETEEERKNTIQRKEEKMSETQEENCIKQKEKNEKRRECVIAALNVNGVKAFRRKVAKTMGPEDFGQQEETAECTSDKIAGICQMFKAAKSGYMLLGDTHTKEGAAATALQHAITQHMPQVEIKVIEPLNNNTGGLIMMWDAKAWTYEHVKVIEKGRIAYGKLQRAGEPQGETWHIFNVYMPVRDHTAGNRAGAERTWQKLHDAVTLHDSRATVVIGDLNAEPHNWVQEGKAKEHWANTKLNELCEEGWIPTITEEATHASGHLIDNILVPKAWERHIRYAYTLRGFTDKDHRIVCTTLEWDKCKPGWERPVGSIAHQLTEDEVVKLDDILSKSKLSIAGTLRDQYNRLINTLNKAIKDMDKRRVSDSGQHNTMGEGVAQKSEAQRNMTKLANAAAMWARRESEARKWSGARSKRASNGLLKVLEEKAPHIAKARTRKQRRRGAIELCKKEREQVEGKIADATKKIKGCQIIQNIAEAVNNKGEVIVNIFDAIHTAKKGVDKGGKIATLYKTGGKATLSWVQEARKHWAENEREQEGIEGDEVELQQLIYAMSLAQKANDKTSVNLIQEALHKRRQENITTPEALQRVVMATGSEVLNEVCKQERELFATEEIDEEAIKELMEWAQITPAKDEHDDNKETRREYFERIMTDEKGLRYLATCQPRKGMGMDGLDLYLIRLAPKNIRIRFVQLIREMVITRQYPMEWSEWIALLVMKPGEDPYDLQRRRDIWLQSHAMKMVEAMLLEEYEEVAKAQVPCEQAGWTAQRNGAEHVMSARLVMELCSRLSISHARCYVDLGTFFESVPNETQWIVEEAMGVNKHAMNTVRDLREGYEATNYPTAGGRFETAKGLTDKVTRFKGLGQGDVLSPARAKLTMAVVQRILARTIKGIRFDNVEANTPFLVYADDGMLIADSANTLQQAIDTLWMVSTTMGLNVFIKNKKKTVWAGVEYVEGKPRDIQGWDMRFPNAEGTIIPQLEGDETYTYLGTELHTAWCYGKTNKVAREKIVHACTKVTRSIGFMDLAPQDLRTAINLAVNGIIGAYGRSTPLTMEDCITIEAEKVRVFQAQHYMIAEPRSIMYDTYHAGGINEQHAYATAAAAIIDQVDRALYEPRESATYRIAHAALKETVLRLGGRPRQYLEWHPAHLEGVLREDNIMEAYLLARIRAKRYVIHTGGAKHADGAMEWEGMERGTHIWEPGYIWEEDGTKHVLAPAPFARDLAALGVAYWEDITHHDGTIMRFQDFVMKFGLRDDKIKDERV